jgi:hypothetical protein
MHERACVRSLHYQNKLRNPWQSIKLQWHDMAPQGQRVTVTMFTYSSGVEHVEQHSERRM